MIFNPSAAGSGESGQYNIVKYETLRDFSKANMKFMSNQPGGFALIVLKNSVDGRKLFLPLAPCVRVNNIQLDSAGGLIEGYYNTWTLNGSLEADLQGPDIVFIIDLYESQEAIISDDWSVEYYTINV